MPTAEATVLYDYAVEILEKAREAKDSINRAKNQPTGELIIGASTIPGTYMLPKIIKRFRETYPLIEFSLLISDSKGIFDKLLSLELFIGAIGAKLSNSKINYIPFGEDDLIIVSSPGIIKKSSLGIEQLKSYPFILREEGSGTRKEMERLLEQKGLALEDLKIAGIFGSTEAVKEAVKAGLGIAAVSRLSVKDELSSGTLKEVRIPGLEMKRKFYIITHKKRTLPPQYKLFLDYLLSRA